MEIRTICKRLADADKFDEYVNFELSRGFVLKKRERIEPNALPHGYIADAILYAELVKDEKEEKPVKEEAKEFDPVEAIKGLIVFCSHNHSCPNCPMFDPCRSYFKYKPENWGGVCK